MSTSTPCSVVIGARPSSSTPVSATSVSDVSTSVDSTGTPRASAISARTDRSADPPSPRCRAIRAAARPGAAARRSPAVESGEILHLAPSEQQHPAVLEVLRLSGEREAGLLQRDPRDRAATVPSRRRATPDRRVDVPAHRARRSRTVRLCAPESGMATIGSGRRQASGSTRPMCPSARRTSTCTRSSAASRKTSTAPGGASTRSSASSSCIGLALLRRTRITRTAGDRRPRPCCRRRGARGRVGAARLGCAGGRGVACVPPTSPSPCSPDARPWRSRRRPRPGRRPLRHGR